MRQEAKIKMTGVGVDDDVAHLKLSVYPALNRTILYLQSIMNN